MYYQGEQLRCLLALVRIPGMGSARLSEILFNQSDLTNLFDSQGRCRVLEGTADWSSVDKDLRWAENESCHIVTKRDAFYPPLLKETQGAPCVLFVRGNMRSLSDPQIAIVGTRNPSRAGSEIAYEFARYFATRHITVTSGLASGIDTAAHKGVLAGRGNTIAVFAQGLDHIYPAGNRALAHAIETQGALVSEFPIGVPPVPTHFPRRNRIISGLSLGTLVVEAAIKSGSLITANYALEQGREVFAVPGSIHNALAKGCHMLIRQGAKLVETAEDVLEELGALMKYVIGSKIAEGGLSTAPLEETAEALLLQVGYDSTSVDSLVARSGLTAQVVSSLLVQLELEGRLVSVPGGYARLVGVKECVK